MYKQFKLTDSDKARFNSNVRFSNENECWEWGGVKVKGYGVFLINKNAIKAHRVAYFISNGNIDNTLICCHKCDNPGCCNPNHLFLGTHADNAADKVKKGRQSKGILHSMSVPKEKGQGERNGNSKMTASQIADIRNRYNNEKASIKKIAKDFGITSSTVHCIVSNKNWKHLEENYLFKKREKAVIVRDKPIKHQLNESQVIEIRDSYKNKSKTVQDISKFYGISDANVYYILKKKSWSSVEGDYQYVKNENTNKKLTESQIEDIRNRYLNGKESQRQLAKIFNVSGTTIHGIVNNKGKAYFSEKYEPTKKRYKYKMLTLSQLEEIKSKWNSKFATAPELAKNYNIGLTTVRRIIKESNT